ncbi:hypothetical protein K7X08_022454 [Anisodus acutangulus]|uniref:Peptidase A1 domain-containing protein n=1 Tax=Anisodus acutangulus TaxID=402998 RepID=A0A9Q1RKD2_9SOLA|nr:hypothetical protein K7X08_022454 [Anisodus acutangulus]
MPLPYTIDDSKEQWENIALMVPSKTIEELKKHYQLLVDDVTAIEYGYVPIPNYTVEENSHGYSRVLRADWQSNGNELPGTAQYQERRKGTPWTEEEHRHLGKRRLEKHIKELCDIEDTIPSGCGHDNEGLFIGSAGLIGLGGGSLSFPSQIKASSFSYCLVDRNSDSSSTLEFNSAGPSDAVLAPLLRNSRRSTFFYVGVEGISVGGETLPIPANIFQVDETGHGGIIVDSGTAVTRLQTTVYNSLRDTFFKYAQNNLPSTDGFMLFDTCFDLSSMKTASVPTVAFHFSGGKDLSLHPKNTLVPVDSEGKYCLAFAPTDESLAIIGNLQQQGTRVSYDLTNNLVGFSPDKC